MRRTTLVLAAAAGWLTTACGSVDRVEPARGDASTLLATVAPDELVVGPAPSTTLPEPVQPLTCTEEPVTIAERTLVARRQRAPSPGCSELVAGAMPDGLCWIVCADGTTFVDFALDPTLLDPTLSDVASSDEGSDRGVEVDYVAVYRTDAGVLDRRAETLVINDNGESWTVAAARPVDLEGEVESAAATSDRYLTALDTGDYATAAELLGAGRPPRPGNRDDLDRLVDEGLLDAKDAEAVGNAAAGSHGDAGAHAALAQALSEWCRRASCRRPDAVRTEITADHRVEIVASYDTDLGTFDVRFDAGTDGDVPFVAGLPPVLP